MQLEDGPKGERHHREAPASQDTGHLHGGRAAVEDDGLPIAEKLPTPGADPDLLVGVAERPHGVGRLLSGLLGSGGAPMDTAKDALSFERFEVPAHGHLGAAERGGQTCHLDLLVLPQGLHDLASASPSVHGLKSTINLVRTHRSLGSLELMTVTQRTGRGSIEAVVFDIGGVLVDWDPRHLYRKVFSDTDRMERFLSEVCTPAWHAQHDLGVPFSSSIPALVAEYPEWTDEIRAWEVRFEEMWNGTIPGSVEILTALRAADNRVPMYAATNWGSDNWRLAKSLFPFLGGFDGELVSGEVQLLKPDPRFFDLLVDRFGLTPALTLYIDDNLENVRAALQKGFVVCHFTSAGQLNRLLVELGLIF